MEVSSLIWTTLYFIQNTDLYQAYTMQAYKFPIDTLVSTATIHINFFLTAPTILETNLKLIRIYRI